MEMRNKIWMPLPFGFQFAQFYYQFTNKWWIHLILVGGYDLKWMKLNEPYFSVAQSTNQKLLMEWWIHSNGMCARERDCEAKLNFHIEYWIRRICGWEWERISDWIYEWISDEKALPRNPQWTKSPMDEPPKRENGTKPPMDEIPKRRNPQKTKSPKSKSPNTQNGTKSPKILIFLFNNKML